MANHKKSFFERLTGAVPLRQNGDAKTLKLEEESLKGENEVFLEGGDEGELTVDVYQTPTEIIVKAMVAGVRPEDLDIVISRDMVVVKGRRESERTISDDNYFFKELYWGTFSRTIVLPQEIEPEEAEATERHGLITIRLPKVNRERQTKLKVKSV
ncbi:MAG: Hsp20/alpha crystallin family protein [Candidatus Taylorbacteria bacterium]|nr:Hsp20/alpha crystallin family protein [Candidatus Taylorbacteria bacterium]